MFKRELTSDEETELFRLQTDKRLWALENPPKFKRGDRVRIILFKSITPTETINNMSKTVYVVIKHSIKEYPMSTRDCFQYPRWNSYELISEDFLEDEIRDEKYLELI